MIRANEVKGCGDAIDSFNLNKAYFEKYGVKVLGMYTLISSMSITHLTICFMHQA